MAPGLGWNKVTIFPGSVWWDNAPSPDPTTGSPCCQALLLTPPLWNELESWETDPGMAVPGLQGLALASGCDEDLGRAQTVLGPCRSQALLTKGPGGGVGVPGGGRLLPQPMLQCPLRRSGWGAHGWHRSSAKVALPHGERHAYQPPECFASAGHLSPRFAPVHRSHPASSHPRARELCSEALPGRTLDTAASSVLCDLSLTCPLSGLLYNNRAPG